MSVAGTASGGRAARAVRHVAELGPAGASALTIAVVALLTLLAAVAGDAFPAVLFAIVGAVALAAIRWPYLGLVGALAVTPTYGWVVVGPSVSAFQVLLPAAALGALLAHRHELGSLAGALLRRPAVVLAAGFLAALCLSAAVRWGDGDPAYVRNYVGSVLLLVVAAVVLRSARQRLVLVAVTVAACAATAAVGLVQIVTTDAFVAAWVLPSLQEVQDAYDRFGAPWGLGAVAFNYAKDVLVGFLLVVPFLVGAARGAGRAWLWAAAGVLAIGLFMSSGRSDWLGAALALVYLAVVLRRHRVLVAAAVALAAIFVLCIARPATPVDVQQVAGFGTQASAPAAPPPTGESGTPHDTTAAVAGRRDEASVEISNNLRVRLTRGGLEMVRDNPLFGVGAGAFRDHIDEYEPVDPEELNDPRPRLPAHNVLLELWADSGTPAFLLYVAFLGTVLLGLDRRRRTGAPGDRTIAIAVTAALIGLIVTSLFHNYQTENLLWGLLGLALSLELWGGGAGDRAPAGAEPARVAPV